MTVTFCSEDQPASQLAKMTKKRKPDQDHEISGTSNFLKFADCEKFSVQNCEVQETTDC